MAFRKFKKIDKRVDIKREKGNVKDRNEGKKIESKRQYSFVELGNEKEKMIEMDREEVCRGRRKKEERRN